MAEVNMKGLACERCGHTWVPRNKTASPRVCPRCKSPHWDRPRSPRLNESPAVYASADTNFVKATWDNFRKTPTIEQLIAEQDMKPITDWRKLVMEDWPKGTSVAEFLRLIHEDGPSYYEDDKGSPPP